ncbi:MAG: orange carotenoid protein N-terminal domain-containing protein [Heteroscytonema crispum UTEX LB 1556]
MTSTNVNRLEETISKFRSLSIEDKLGVLALLYNKIGRSIPTDELDAIADDSIHPMVTQIQQLVPKEQLALLSDLLTQKESDRPDLTDEYASISAESKLGFWSVIAQKVGDTIIGVPGDYHPSAQVDEVLGFLKSLDIKDLAFFLKEIM